ncbi:MAG: insulinase family protein [Bryobacterales bacterium]|nr:insulinase family protein [Bryobacterales bacterium]
MRRTRFTLTALIAAMTLSAQTIDRTRPPQTGALPPFKLPPVFETVLPNGLRVVLVEDRRFPLVTLRLAFEAGAKFDPEDLPGLSEAVGSLLTEGTRARTSRQIAEELADIGASMRAASGPDGLTVSAGALAENLPKLLDLLADVTLNAAFPEDEVKLYRNRRTQELLAERSEAAFWADQKITAVVFGSHPYSRENPTPESIAKLDRKALAQFRDIHLAANNAVLILLGAIPPREQTLGLIRRRFDAWKKQPLAARPAPRFPAAARSITLIDRPGSVQADIRVGRLSVDRLDPDYFPVVVANTILGGGASSRMFMNIREKQGFAYDAHSSNAPRKNAGLFTTVTQVRNEVLEPALKAVEAELDALVKQPVAESELEDVKNYLSGTFVLGLETQAGLASQLANMKLLGLPESYLETFTARIRAVGPAAIQKAAARYMAAGGASIVVVGDAAQIAKTLEKFGKVTLEKAE